MKKIPIKYYILGGISLLGISYGVYVAVRNKITYKAIIKAVDEGTGESGSVEDWKNNPAFGSSVMLGGKGNVKKSTDVQKAIVDIYDSVSSVPFMTNISKAVGTVKLYAQSLQQFSQLSSAFFIKYKYTLYDHFNKDSETLNAVITYLKTLPVSKK